MLMCESPKRHVSANNGVFRVAPLNNSSPRYFDGNKKTKHALRIFKGDILLFCKRCGKSTYHSPYRKYKYSRGVSPPQKTWYKCDDCGHDSKVHCGNSKFVKLSLNIREKRGGFR